MMSEKRLGVDNAFFGTSQVYSDLNAVSTRLDTMKSKIHRFHTNRIPINTLSVFIPPTLSSCSLESYLFKALADDETAIPQITRVEVMADYSRSFSNEVWAMLPAWLRRTFPALSIVVLNDRSRMGVYWPLAHNQLVGPEFSESLLTKQCTVVQSFVAAIEVLFITEVQVVVGRLEDC
jgi:hypothetical protein